MPLTACTGDQSAAAFALGQPEADCALVNVGTGAFIQRLAPADARLPDGILRSVLCADADGLLTSHEGTVNGAGSALDWLRERVALDVDRGLVALASRDPLPGALPLFLNGVGGLGAPFWMADFPCEFVGDGLEAAQIAAVVESIAVPAVHEPRTPAEQRIRCVESASRAAWRATITCAAASPR